MDSSAPGPLVIRAGSVETSGERENLDRYLVDGRTSNGLVAVIEHVPEPAVLAAPMHRHSREDEYSLVLAGTLGVIDEGTEVRATTGDLVVKHRGRWHTFWNAGDDELHVIEIIAPGGVEELFRRLAEPGGEYSPETLPALAAEYGCEVDFEATMPLIERHGLRF